MFTTVLDDDGYKPWLTIMIIHDERLIMVDGLAPQAAIAAGEVDSTFPKVTSALWISATAVASAHQVLRGVKGLALGFKYQWMVGAMHHGSSTICY